MKAQLRSFASSLALMSVLLAQLVIAHHLSIHLFEHDGSGSVLQISVAGHADPGQKTGKPDLCDICVAEKAVNHAVWTGMVALPVQEFTGLSFDIALFSEPPVVQLHSYYSRGPPSLC
jgi:hypothetical protein